MRGILEERLPVHHSSHRHLLAETSSSHPAAIDAIIVPTARPVAYLRTAMALANSRRCPLVVLCSRKASATDTMKMAWPFGIEILAIDTAELPRGALPPFATSQLLRGTKFDRRSDTSAKRNLGLLLAQIAGWERIVFLDDDITIPRPDDLNNAAGLLDRCAGVGLSIDGYPDNSVVCHAFRDAGGHQDTFIGGGALAVGRQSFDAFFPDIYNEDWFFLLGDNGLRPSAVTGTAVQAPYDPYRETMRARSEELGDCLAEGLFTLLDDGRTLADADAFHWAVFLRRRRQFIDGVIAMAEGTALSRAEKNRMIAALKAAKGRNWTIETGLCVKYLRAWQGDRDVWQQHVAMATRLFSGGGLQKLLASLGLMHRYRAAP